MNPVSSLVLIICAMLLPGMGFFPGIIMDTVADMGASFLQITPLSRKLSYFSITNITGAIISFIIGSVIYLVAVRFWLMKRISPDTPERQYVNRLPHWMDLE